MIGYGLTKNISYFAGSSPKEIGQRLVEMGFSGVFLKELTPDWIDALQCVDLQVYASVAVFLDNEDLWTRWPDSRPINAEGNPAPEQEWYRPLLPTHPNVRQHRLRQIEELLSRLPLDGLWLDFIRWPARWEQPQPQLYHSSFDPLTLSQFRHDQNIELPIDDPRAASAILIADSQLPWFKWRCEQISSFVNDVRSLVQRVRPSTKLGLFAIPWTGTKSDKLPISTANLHVVGQDLSQLCQIVDVISPMVYHRLCGMDAQWVENVAQWFHERIQRSTCRAAVWPVVEALEPSSCYPVDEFASVVRLSGERSNGQVIVFQLKELVCDLEKLAWIQDTYR